MSFSILYDTYKGASNVTLTDIETNIPYVFPKPSSLDLAPGVQIKQTMTMSDLGIMVPSNQFQNAENPVLTLGYAHIQPEIIAFALGNTLVSETRATYIPKLVTAQAGGIAASASGYVGYGVAADAVSFASVRRQNISVALTQDTYAGYSGWRTTPDKFAVGADGAILFSDNLVAAQDAVSMSIPYTASFRTISEIVANPVRITATMINNRNKVTILDIPYAKPDPSSVQIQPGAENFQLRFFCNFLPGECRSWRLLDPNELGTVC